MNNFVFTKATRKERFC